MLQNLLLICIICMLWDSCERESFSHERGEDGGKEFEEGDGLASLVDGAAGRGRVLLLGHVQDGSPCRRGCRTGRGSFRWEERRVHWFVYAGGRRSQINTFWTIYAKSATMTSVLAVFVVVECINWTEVAQGVSVHVIVGVTAVNLVTIFILIYFHIIVILLVIMVGYWVKYRRRRSGWKFRMSWKVGGGRAVVEWWLWMNLTTGIVII